MAIFKPFTPIGEINNDIKGEVKNYILKVGRNESVRWSGYPCVVLRDGRPVWIKSGSSWQSDPHDYPNDIYIAFNPSIETPPWFIGVITGIAYFFKLADDPEVKQALFDLACRMAADIFRPLRQSLLESAHGIELTTFAINDETRALAAEYPPVFGVDPADGTDQSVYRVFFSGEEVDITQPGWNTFTLDS